MDEYKEIDPVSLTEKIEIISTEDEKIKSIGELLSADSSRTILRLLFNERLTANQISQKTGISLPLVIYHLKKMQEMGIVKISDVGKNVKAQDMKYYTSTKFAIVILPSTLTEKARTSKSLFNSFRTIYRFASIGIAAVTAWFVSQYAENQAAQTSLNSNPTTSTTTMEAAKNLGQGLSSAPSVVSPSTPATAPAMPSGGVSSTQLPQTSPIHGPTGLELQVDILWSIIITLSVVIVGLIIERVLRALRH